jgi:hypothetical protein
VAQDTHLYSTFDSKFFPDDGAIHHEDLVDMVTILAMTQTPAFSGFPKTRARDVVHSWVVDTLAAATASGHPEGEDFAGTVIVSATRLMNGTQIFKKGVIVSDRERSANVAGIRDMYDHQVMKRFKELARDVETTLFRAATTASATATEATSPLMAGFRGFTGLSTAGATTGEVRLADIYSASMTMFTNGAEPDSIWFAPAHKRDFFNAVTAGGTGLITRNIAATDNRLQANIEVMESPFGQLFAIITDAFIPTGSGTATSATAGYYIGDRSMAKLAFYRPPQHKEMGKNGDHTRGLVLMELTLQLDHPSSWMCVTGLTSV